MTARDRLPRAVAVARHRRRRLARRAPPLPGDRDADVAIVGAGFTGLWTAYYLAKADPSLRVVVLEREVAGFGASGRNGGWCSALFPASWRKARPQRRREAARSRMQRAHVRHGRRGRPGRRRGGHRLPLGQGRHRRRSRAPPCSSSGRAPRSTEARAWGFGEEDLPAARRATRRATRLGATDVLGGDVHPALRGDPPGAAGPRPGAAPSSACGVHDLRADAGHRDRAGRRAHRRTARSARERRRPGDRGLHADAARAPARRRAGLLADARDRAAARRRSGTQIGLADRETFTDHRHLIIYGQRTADGRLAFGGRGAPYHFGSRIRPEYDRDPRRASPSCSRVLVELFPPLRRRGGHHRGAARSASPRDWFASVGLDRTTGLGWAGGYVGDGVGTTNLAGRTLADLVLGARHRPDPAAVGRTTARRAGSPSRCAGSASTPALRVMGGADAEELRTGRPSRRAALLGAAARPLTPAATASGTAEDGAPHVPHGPRHDDQPPHPGADQREDRQPDPDQHHEQR